MKRKIINRTPSAFTLVELSFVVVIIGFLIAAVAGGQKLVSIAKISQARTATQSAPLTSIDNLSLWLDTTSKNSFRTTTPGNGALIDTWNDINTQSPNKKIFTAAGTARPTYTENAINGLPALSFNGTTNVMSRANSYGYEFTRTNEVTIFVVLKTLSPAQNSVVLFMTTGASQLNIHAPWSDGNIYWDFAGCCGATVRTVQAAPVNFLDNANILSTIRRADGSGDITINNTVLISKVAGTLTASIPLDTVATFTIGGGISTFQKGYISEIIMFDRALAASERKRVTEYLSKKWNITIS